MDFIVFLLQFFNNYLTSIARSASIVFKHEVWLIPDAHNWHRSDRPLVSVDRTEHKNQAWCSQQVSQPD